MTIKNIAIMILLMPPLMCASDSGVVKFKKAFVRAPQAMGNVSVFKDAEGFKVKQNGSIKYINHFDVEKPLRELNNDKLAQLKHAGAILKIRELSNGDVMLGMEPNLKGGGPICGAIAAWLVRAVGYGSIVTTVTVAGTTLAPAGISGAVVGMGTTVITGSASTGATLFAAGAAGAGGAVSTNIALGTAAVLTQGASQAIAAIETSATLAQAAVTLMPWCP